MELYLAAASGHFTNPFIFNLYCVTSAAQSVPPFSALFAQPLAPKELTALFVQVQTVHGCRVEDEYDAITALLATLQTSGWRDDSISANTLLVHYNALFASARNEFVTLCQVAFAEMEQRLVASQPPKRVICLTDEQADQLEQHTLAEGASLAHLHSIRVINSSDVLYSKWLSTS